MDVDVVGNVIMAKNVILFLVVIIHQIKIIIKRQKRKDEKREATREGCFRCGGRGHYARDCRTPKHLVELYQESLKKKEKNPEANFISENQVDITHLDVADFFAHPEGKIDHLIGDGSVNMEE